MKQLTALPRMTMPGEYMEILATLLADIPVPADATEDTVTVRLDGPGGGHWTVGVVDDAFTIVEGVRGPEFARMTLSVSDWREFALGRVRDTLLGVMGTPQLSPALLNRLQGAPKQLDALRPFSGTITLCIEDEDDDATYRLTVELGSAVGQDGPPTTSISVDLSQAADLIGRRENVQSAFFAGKIRLDGDMNLAMGLMASIAQGA